MRTDGLKQRRACQDEDGWMDGRGEGSVADRWMLRARSQKRRKGTTETYASFVYALLGVSQAVDRPIDKKRDDASVYRSSCAQQMDRWWLVNCQDTY